MIMNFLKKVPAGMMIVPLLIGAILNTFCSSVLQVGYLQQQLFQMQVQQQRWEFSWYVSEQR